MYMASVPRLCSSDGRPSANKANNAVCCQVTHSVLLLSLQKVEFSTKRRIVLEDDDDE